MSAGNGTRANLAVACDGLAADRRKVLGNGFHPGQTGTDRRAVDDWNGISNGSKRCSPRARDGQLLSGVLERAHRPILALVHSHAHRQTARTAAWSGVRPDSSQGYRGSISRS